MAPKITAILIDDEQEALELLGLHLANMPEVRVLGKYTEPQEGFIHITKLGPDVVFLDIEMPHHNGFDIMDCLQNMKKPPHIVFVTGFDKYLSNIDLKQGAHMLLKPVDPEKLGEVIDKIKVKTHKNNNGVAQAVDSIKKQHRLIVPTQNVTVYLKYNDIVFLKSDGNYTVIITQDGKEIMSSYNLKKFEQQLPKDQFVRCHSANLINSDYLFKIDKKNNTCTLSADNDYTIRVSRSGMKILDAQY